MVNSRNTVQFLDKIDHIYECQHKKLVKVFIQVLELIFKLPGNIS